jgi:hypothetical protein
MKKFGLCLLSELKNSLRSGGIWVQGSRQFKDFGEYLLLTAVLADAISLGLSKMAESCPGTTYAKLAWLQAWHI